MSSPPKSSKRRTRQEVLRDATSGTPKQSEEQSLEELLEILQGQAVENAKPVASARKDQVVKTPQEKRKDVVDDLEAKRLRYPKRATWRGDSTGRQFHSINAGYLVDLDPKKWKYENMTSTINPDAKPTFRWAGIPNEEFGDGSNVPVTPALTQLLVKNQKKFLAYQSRRRVEERLLPIPRAFDLTELRPAWSAPPTQCRFFGEEDQVDPVELRRQKQVQTVRFREQGKK